MKIQLELTEQQLTFLYDLVRVATHAKADIEIRNLEERDNVEDLLRHEYHGVHGDNY